MSDLRSKVEASCVSPETSLDAAVAARNHEKHSLWNRPAPGGPRCLALPEFHSPTETWWQILRFLTHAEGPSRLTGLFLRSGEERGGGSVPPQLCFCALAATFTCKSCSARRRHFSRDAPPLKAARQTSMLAFRAAQGPSPEREFCARKPRWEK